MQIIPTILEKEFFKAEERLNSIKDLTSWVQIDVIDGIFVPGKTFELELLNKIDIDKTFLWDIHLMVKDPIKWLEKCMFIGASRVIGQVEMMENTDAFVQKAKDMGFEVGLAYDIDTHVNRIPRETDLILLMGRKAGFDGAEFDQNVLHKIDKNNIYAIDGGVNMNNIEIIKKAGIEILYCGKSFFELKEKYADQN
jgi:ribulose-phosphate 3-epimerase